MKHIFYILRFHLPKVRFKQASYARLEIIFDLSISSIFVFNLGFWWRELKWKQYEIKEPDLTFSYSSIIPEIWHYVSLILNYE